MKSSLFYCLICLFLFSCSSKKDKPDEGNVQTVLPDEVTEVHAMRLGKRSSREDKKKFSESYN